MVTGTSIAPSYATKDLPEDDQNEASTWLGLWLDIKGACELLMRSWSLVNTIFIGPEACDCLTVGTGVCKPADTQHPLAIRLLSKT